MIYCQENISGLPYFLPLDTNIKKSSQTEITQSQVNLEEGINSTIYCQKTVSGFPHSLPLLTNIKNTRHTSHLQVHF